VGLGSVAHPYTVRIWASVRCGERYSTSGNFGLAILGSRFKDAWARAGTRAVFVILNAYRDAAWVGQGQSRPGFAALLTCVSIEIPFYRRPTDSMRYSRNRSCPAQCSRCTRWRRFWRAWTYLVIQRPPGPGRRASQPTLVYGACEPVQAGTGRRWMGTAVLQLMMRCCSGSDLIPMFRLLGFFPRRFPGGFRRIGLGRVGRIGQALRRPADIRDRLRRHFAAMLPIASCVETMAVLVRFDTGRSHIRGQRFVTLVDTRATYHPNSYDRPVCRWHFVMSSSRQYVFPVRFHEMSRTISDFFARPAPLGAAVPQKSRHDLSRFWPAPAGVVDHITVPRWCSRYVGDGFRWLEAVKFAILPTRPDSPIIRIQA